MTPPPTNPRTLKKLITSLLAVLTSTAITLGVTGCGPGGPFGLFGPTLKLIAGSEVKDLEPLFDDIKNNTGVKIDITYSGTLDGTENLVTNGKGNFDATWFPSNFYLSLFTESADLIDQQKSIMSSPVVLGLKPDAAQKLGWSSQKQPTWEQLTQAVQEGKLTFGMTSPLASNSGFATLLESATALSGTGNALTENDLGATAKPLTSFAKGVTITAGSSGWLADNFAQDTSKADGLFNYESVLLSANWGGQTPVIIAPSDGVVTADYPLTLLKGADDTATQAYTKVVDYLLQDDVQKRISDTTHRRTTASNSTDFPTTFETPYPATLQTVHALLQTWLAQARKPANMYFQIDTSGSMEGERLTQLKQALGVLTGSTARSQTESLLALQPREKLTVVEFGSGVKAEYDYDLTDPAKTDTTRQTMDTDFSQLVAGGNTELYSTLKTTLQAAVQQKKPDTFTSVVVFTDGQNTGDVTVDQFLDWYNATDFMHGVPIFTISFGEADTSELEKVANASGGRVFSSDAGLTSVFKEIRGYL